MSRDYASYRRRRKGEPSGAPRPERVSRLKTSPEPERAFLVGVGPEADGPAGSLPMLDELAELARTAGAEVVGRLYQRREKPHAGSYLGTGRLHELATLCQEVQANLVIADSDLTPAQVRTVEAEVNLRVIDRSELIIDIFATHARTRQARLQVELAQLEYQAPRLKRMWTHLSRITGAGGIGSRGPGEKQIEVDRRIIQRRIQDLRAELRQIEARRVRQVRSRKGVFKVALVGYTNAGKSTLMNALTGAGALVADQLFATLDTRTRRWSLEDGLEVLLSDTVGFIDKLPHHLVASFHATLEEVREATLLLQVVDAGDMRAVEQVAVVQDVLNRIDAGEVPVILVLNKCDLVADAVEATILAARLGARVCISAQKGDGLAELTAMVRDRVRAEQRVVELRVPTSDGGTLALLARAGHVLQRRYQGEHCYLTVSIPSALEGALARYQVDPTSPTEGG